jgi:hypothetical protein
MVTKHLILLVICSLIAHNDNTSAIVFIAAPHYAFGQAAIPVGN